MKFSTFAKNLTWVQNFLDRYKLVRETRISPTIMDEFKLGAKFSTLVKNFEFNSSL
jgi:hypothetical protein